MIDDQPAFVGLSTAGQIVRLVGRTSRTITAVSGDVVEVAVHPVKPLIAVQHSDSSISVFDLIVEKVVLTVRNNAQ